MYAFAFETEIGADLALMPLGLRRKLDIAGLKFPLQTWQALRFEARCQLCEAEPDTIGAEAYAALARALAAGHPGELKPLPALGAVRPWQEASAKARVLARSAQAGRPLAEAAFEALDDERRYILWRLSEPGRGVEKLRLALEAFA